MCVFGAVRCRGVIELGNKEEMFRGTKYIKIGDIGNLEIYANDKSVFHVEHILFRQEHVYIKLPLLLSRIIKMKPYRIRCDRCGRIYWGWYVKNDIWERLEKKYWDWSLCKKCYRMVLEKKRSD